MPYTVSPPSLRSFKRPFARPRLRKSRPTTNWVIQQTTSSPNFQRTAQTCPASTPPMVTLVYVLVSLGRYWSRNRSGETLTRCPTALLGLEKPGRHLKKYLAV